MERSKNYKSAIRDHIELYAEVAKENN